MNRYIFEFGLVRASVLAPSPDDAVAYLTEWLRDNEGSGGYDLDMGVDSECFDPRQYVRVEASIIPETITTDHIVHVDLGVEK